MLFRDTQLMCDTVLTPLNLVCHLPKCPMKPLLLAEIIPIKNEKGDKSEKIIL